MIRGHFLRTVSSIFPMLRNLRGRDTSHVGTHSVGYIEVSLYHVYMSKTGFTVYIRMSYITSELALAISQLAAKGLLLQSNLANKFGHM